MFNTVFDNLFARTQLSDAVYKKPKGILPNARYLVVAQATREAGFAPGPVEPLSE